MKILILGNKDHQYIYNHVKWLKLNSNCYKVDVLSVDTNRKGLLANDDLYDNVYSISTHTTPYIARKSIECFLFRKKLREIAADYDIIQIHYVENIILLSLDILFSSSCKIVVTVWGSDWYKANSIKKQGLKQLFRKADVVTIEHQQIGDEIKNFCKVRRMEELRLGLEPLEALASLDTISKEESKQFLTLPLGLITICIGYNARKNQQHLEIIRILNLLPEEIKERIILLLPLTYPHDDMQYVDEVESALIESRYKYKIFKQYMTDIEVAYLRKATDIMLQLQLTDSLSGAMLEHLYAESCVVTGKWLPYDLLISRNIHFHRIEAMDKLSSCIISIINNINDEISMNKPNTNIIQRLSRWPLVIKDWQQLYKDIL